MLKLQHQLNKWYNISKIHGVDSIKKKLYYYFDILCTVYVNSI
jgi:hypothetical protein